MNPVNEKIAAIVGDDPGKVEAISKIFQSETDRRVESGIRTYRDETLPGLVDAEIQKRTKLSGDEIIARKERALEFAHKTGLDYHTVSKILVMGDSPDETLAALESDLERLKINTINDVMKTAPAPPRSQRIPPSGAITQEDLKRMTPAQIAEACRTGKADALLGRVK